ncbi:hypothetical protein NL676_038916 [Syzygium grande]|nr:hypothetical protein NL676_038916 [Syzygium grande]
MDIQTVEERYISRCRDHGALPNPTILSGFFKAEVKKTRHELCTLEIMLDRLKDIDFHPLLDVVVDIEASEIEAVDIYNKSSGELKGEYALLLIRALNNKLRVVDLQDFSLGKDFCRDLSSRGLTCEVLNMRSSHFRKLSMVGKFSRTHTLNLDYSTSLTSFHKDCFACMPNLKFLSMCETRIANLWTTTAALSKLPSLVELRFQRRLYYEDIESYIASSSGNEDGRVGPFPEEPMIDTATLVDQNLISETMLNNLMTVANVMGNPELQREGEESSDDSEVDFSSQRQEYGFMHELTAAISEWSGRVDVHDEVDSGASLSHSEEESIGASSTNSSINIASRYISCCSSPICFKKHYREFMIASLPHLKMLDELPIRKNEREQAAATFSQYFEQLPYRRKAKESVLSILQNREIKESRNLARTNKQKNTYPSGKSQYFYTRSLCAARVGSCPWPSLQPLSCSSSGDEALNFRPRQFEYHPSDSSLMVFGTLDGEVIIINHENGKIVSCIPSYGAMSSVLGLCWLKKHPSLLIAGSDNGSLKLYDIHQLPPNNSGTYSGAGSVTFDDFDQLTSVHVNSADELLLASGYSKNVALYDINSGRRLQVFTNMHQEHINVVKFANHSPSLFATSSFDHDVKLWDLRQKPFLPCYTATSSKGNVMVCFSPDDHYLLASAVDNEVKQFRAADGKLLLDFGINPTGSSQNYTRSYYMNSRDYIISGSCDEHVVRICCAQTGRRLRDVSLEGRGSGSSMFVQSLRGDPHRDFNMSILAAYMRPSSKSEIVKVNLLASSDDTKEYSNSQDAPKSNSLGG